MEGWRVAVGMGPPFSSPRDIEEACALSKELAWACAVPLVQVKGLDGKFQKTNRGSRKMQSKSEELKFVTKNDGFVYIHPSSVNYQVRVGKGVPEPTRSP